MALRPSIHCTRIGLAHEHRARAHARLAPRCVAYMKITVCSLCSANSTLVLWRSGRRASPAQAQLKPNRAKESTIAHINTHGAMEQQNICTDT